MSYHDDAAKWHATVKPIRYPDGSRVYPVAGLHHCWGAMTADGECITNPAGRSGGPMEAWYWPTPEAAKAAIDQKETTHV